MSHMQDRMDFRVCFDDGVCGLLEVFGESTRGET